MNNNPNAAAPTNVDNIILKLATPVMIRNKAPNKIAIFEVSPTLPGIVPMNISIMLGSCSTPPPFNNVPNGVAPE